MLYVIVLCVYYNLKKNLLILCWVLLHYGALFPKYYREIRIEIKI